MAKLSGIGRTDILRNYAHKKAPDVSIRGFFNEEI
ncbi:hypothetical protein CFII64_17491 [Pseudomonas sp. CFII64]|nr:hypothetical protein CFII64_17491 [Pseudomonas sp. CFII64]